jgi:hypothetical protein
MAAPAIFSLRSTYQGQCHFTENSHPPPSEREERTQSRQVPTRKRRSRTWTRAPRLPSESHDANRMGHARERCEGVSGGSEVREVEQQVSLAAGDAPWILIVFFAFCIAPACVPRASSASSAPSRARAVRPRGQSDDGPSWADGRRGGLWRAESGSVEESEALRPASERARLARCRRGRERGVSRRRRPGCIQRDYPRICI